MKFGQLFVAACWLALAGCAANLGQDARFGTYGGRGRDAGPQAAFDVASTKFGVRWFPTHLRWAPDGSHLLVSLCHVNQPDYCRIGKYWLADKRWELLHLKPQTTYRWPSYAPDGRRFVVSVGTCNEQFACSAARLSLTLMDADGGHPVELLRTIAQKPSFSDDGRKIIYWRHTGGGAADIGMYDLDTGREQKLTQLHFQDNWTQTGAPYFLPDGERFVFSGRPLLLPQLGGTKLDPAGPNHGLVRYAWDRRKGAVTPKNFTEADLLWPDGEFAPINDGSLDVSAKGEVLYLTGPRSYGAQIRSGRYKGNVVQITDNRQLLLALRPAREDAPFSAVFRLPYGANVAAISPDGQRVAFSEIPTGVFHFSQRLGTVRLTDQAVEFIDWPKLELDPAAAQTTSTAQ